MPFFNCYFLICDATNQTVEKVGKRSTISFAVAKERILIIDWLSTANECGYCIFSPLLLVYQRPSTEIPVSKKTTVCHHRVGCARPMVGTSRGRWRWREKIGRRLPSLSSAPARSCPCAFRLNLKPWGRGWFQLTLFTALLHYYLGAWNRLVIRLLFVNQARLLSRLIWLFHVTYEYLWRPVLVKINMIK